MTVGVVYKLNAEITYRRQLTDKPDSFPVSRLLSALHPAAPSHKLGMQLTFAQNAPLRTYIINSSNEILYQINTPDNGSFTTVARKYSTMPTSDAASEHTLVESQWCQLARLCWDRPESSQIHIPTLAQRQDNFKSISR